MWKNYSMSYMKNNRSSSISIMAAAFISALFLSLTCCLFYNIWMYDIEQIVLEEGDWHGRIAGALKDEDFAVTENFANVEKAVVNAELSKGQEIVMDVYFDNPRSIYGDMPLIVNQLGLEDDAVTYNEFLLSRYLIHNPLDDMQPMLLSFYLFILLVVALALMLIIRNSFAVSMNARIHQFGIFSSIGAAPRQILICLMQEAGALCLIPVLIGIISGILLSWGIIQGADALAANVADRHNAVFQYHPLIFVCTIVVSFITVFSSAWLPARKLSRMTPLEAICNTGDLQVKNKKGSPILSLFFGIEGELAGNSLKLRKKALRTAMLSLTLSFFTFALFLSFSAFSRLSVYETSFSQYERFWDIMVTVKDTPLKEMKGLNNIAALENVESPVLYQKAEAWTMIPFSIQSDELETLGGYTVLGGESVRVEGENYSVKTPIVIMDDAGFGSFLSLLIVPILFPQQQFLF